MSTDNSDGLNPVRPTLVGMRPGTRYVVTVGSAEGEFEPGDRVELLPDGTILNHTAGGWMAAEDVADATVGMRVELDSQWLAARRADLERKLSELKR